jgi:hypothetical protein
MFHTRGQATTRAAAVAGARSILLTLALLAGLGAPLAGAAPATAQAVRLELTPAEAVTDVKKPVRYTAELVDANGRSDVTSRMTLQATGPAPCHQDDSRLSCDDNGDFKVTASVDDPEITSDPVVLHVVNPGVAPTLGPPPAASPPNREVSVQGRTGSCSQDGTLSSTELEVDQQVAGIFTATFRIPSGTFPGTYPLSLDVTCDGKTRDPAVVNITVSNQPPDAGNDLATATPGKSVRIPVTGNDTDPDGEDGYKSVLEADPPTVGTADPAGQVIVYTPGPGFVDRDHFTYRNCDVVGANGRKSCGTATVTVTKGKPVPVDDPHETTLQGRQVDIDVMKNDRHPDAELLQVKPEPPPKGTAVVQSDGTIRYTPATGDTGKDSFRYDYCRPPVNLTARENCPSATVTVDVQPQVPPAIRSVSPNPTPPNQEVVVKGTTGSCQEGTLILDIPPPGKDVRVPVTANPNATFTTGLKVPGGTFVGTYTLELRVDCDHQVQTTGTGLQVANKAPTAVDDPAGTRQNTQVTIPVTGNDTDPDGDDGYKTSLEATKPANGETDVQGDRILYTPDKGFTGVDRFRYRFCDIVDADDTPDCGAATVTVTVTAGPVISSVEPGSTPPGKPVKVGGNTGSCGRAGTLALLGTGASVTVTGGQDGAFTTSLTVPAGTFPGPHTLELRVDCRGQPQRAEGLLTVTNQAPVAADDLDSTTRDQPVRIPVADNDRDPDDPDGYQALVLVTRQPDHGTAEAQPDLTVVYTPQAGFVGTDRFRYSLCDDVLNAAGQADCGSAMVTVTVTGTPVISSVDPGSTPPGRPVAVGGNTGSCARTGTLTLQETGLAVTVTADQNGGFSANLVVPESTLPRAYTLELVVDCSGQPQRAEAEVMVTNRPPVAADDRVTTIPGIAVVIDVTANDHDPDDPDGYPTRVLEASPPAHGTTRVEPDQTIRYTPGKGFAGTDRFRYSLCDDTINATGQADCGTATVTVLISPTACAPPAGGSSSLQVDPVKGRGGTRLRITATVDRSLATCHLRVLLGGTPLDPDVSVDPDGSVSAVRGLPGEATPGPSPIRLATMSSLTLAETSFEVVPEPTRWPLRLVIGAGALLAGFLARAVLRRLRTGRNPDRPGEPSRGIRAEPHTRPVEATVEPAHDSTRSFSVRLEPHPDPGAQSVKEVVR